MPSPPPASLSPHSICLSPLSLSPCLPPFLSLALYLPPSLPDSLPPSRRRCVPPFRSKEREREGRVDRPLPSQIWLEAVAKECNPQNFACDVTRARLWVCSWFRGTRSRNRLDDMFYILGDINVLGPRLELAFSPKVFFRKPFVMSHCQPCTDVFDDGEGGGRRREEEFIQNRLTRTPFEEFIPPLSPSLSLCPHLRFP